MSRKPLIACLVIAAFAMVPSLASANPILTEPTGTALAAGAKITATNVGTIQIRNASIGNLECATASLTRELTSNATATGVRANFTAAKFGGTGATQSGAPEPECTGSSTFIVNFTFTPEITLPWCLEASVKSDVFLVRGGSCAEQERSIKFYLDMTGIGTCEYSRTEGAGGTLVTDGAGTNEDTVAITSVPWSKIGGSGVCPSTLELTMRLSLETDDETHSQVSISS